MLKAIIISFLMSEIYFHCRKVENTEKHTFILFLVSFPCITSMFLFCRIEDVRNRLLYNLLFFFLLHTEYFLILLNILQYVHYFSGNLIKQWPGKLRFLCWKTTVGKPVSSFWLAKNCQNFPH